ncbi:MAG: hypothetical protein GC204_14500 [Chloroflexi bacterium]|nr:hypothetical protein [Chloroflexota bacterium]
MSVNDQVSLDGTVTIASVYSAGQGWVVIHIDNNGQPGRVAGFASVAPGWTYNLEIPFDATIGTPVLYAMLHVDDGEVGKYEFDGQSGLDAPVIVNGAVVTPAFKVNVIRAYDQFITADQFVAAAVTVQQDGWLVVHSDKDGAPGPVLGEERVLAGTTTDVAVDLQANGRTEVLWPMLHVDTDTAGEYEFGTVQGADLPVVVRGVLASAPFWTVPHVRVANQIILHGDDQGAPNTSLQIESALSQGPGWVVIHADKDNAPGPVAGFVAVKDGLNTDLTVDNLDASKLTPVLWPMLHVDDSTVGEYEFGTVAGADAPVKVDGQVLTFPINAAPSLVLKAQDPLPGESTGTIRVRVDEALSNGQGWLAIHQNKDGQPGPVIGTALLHAGSNKNVIVEVDQAAAGDQVFPMLHYDTDTIGEYEFGTVQGADLPVIVGGNVVVGPLALTTAAPVETAVPTAAPAEPTAAPASGACTVTPKSTANRRSGPGTTFTPTGQLAFGQTATVTGQTQGADGFPWFLLDDGSFVRSDVVITSGDCSAVPTVESSAPAAPASTPETSG